MDQSSFLAWASHSHLTHNVRSPKFEKHDYAHDSNQLYVNGNYRLSFFDQGSNIKIDIDGNDDSSTSLAMGLTGKKFKIPEEYRGVVESVKLTKAGGLSVTVGLVHQINATGRVQDREKLFAAVYHSAIRPVLEVICGL